MRVLLDENIPHGLRKLLAGHEVEHVTRLGWDGVFNGRLIAAADEAGYEVFITADQSLVHQQNLALENSTFSSSARTIGTACKLRATGSRRWSIWCAAGQVVTRIDLGRGPERSQADRDTER